MYACSGCVRVSSDQLLVLERLNILGRSQLRDLRMKVLTFPHEGEEAIHDS